MKFWFSVVLLLFTPCSVLASTALTARLLELEQLSSTDFMQAEQQFQQLFQTISEPEQLRKAQQSYCWVLVQQDPERGLVFAQSNKNQQQDTLWQLRFLLCEAYAKERKNQTVEAMLDYQLVLSQPQVTADNELYAKALVLRGEQHANNAAYPDALVDLQKAYALEMAHGTKNRQNYVVNALANLYADPAVGDYDQAITMYKKSLQHWQQSNDLEMQATALFNLGSTYESAGQLKLALSYVKRALAIDQQRGDLDEIAYDKRVVARVLTKSGQGEQALVLLNDAIAHYLSRQDDQMLAYCQLSRAMTYRSLKQYQNAQQDFESALRYFEKKNDLRFEALLYKEYALLLADMAQWQDAYLMQQRQQQKDAEIQQQLLDMRTSRLKIQLQTEQILREKTELEIKNATQQQAITDGEKLRFWQYFALFCALLMIITMLFLFMRQKALSARLKDMALTDDLTHLPNRRHSLALAHQMWQQWQYQQQPFSVIAADIDFFKRINDHYGHATGDVVLQKVAYQLRQELRPLDKLGRVGGEEFLVLLPDTDLVAARQIAQRLCDQVAKMNWTELALDEAVTISLGVAQVDKHKGFMQLWRSADMALYKAKENGRNRAEWVE